MRENLFNNNGSLKWNDRTEEKKHNMKRIIFAIIHFVFVFWICTYKCVARFSYVFPSIYFAFTLLNRAIHCYAHLIHIIGVYNKNISEQKTGIHCNHANVNLNRNIFFFGKKCWTIERDDRNNSIPNSNVLCKRMMKNVKISKKIQ